MCLAIKESVIRSIGPRLITSFFEIFFSNAVNIKLLLFTSWSLTELIAIYLFISKNQGNQVRVVRCN